MQNKLIVTLGKNKMLINTDSSVSVKENEILQISLANMGYLYGHGFSMPSVYPLNQSELNVRSFAVNNIQSPIWMLSSGYVIFADTCDVIQVEITKQSLMICCVADFTLHILCAESLTAAHKKLLIRLGKRGTKPNECFVNDSLFCTWTQYPRCISQSTVLSFAKEIRDNNYPCSAITIDDKWESKYGDLKFDNCFESPAQMVNQLHNMGFKVILWVTPFIDIKSQSFEDLCDKHLLVWSKIKNEPAVFKWWGGDAALVDITNLDGENWYKCKLNALKNQYGIDGFKIDGGDAKYQPDFADAQWFNYKGASGYSDLLLGIFEQIAPGMCETRTAWLSRSRNIVWREGGKDSNFTSNNGLKAVLSLALNLSLLGYDFVIPDMVGGRVQTMSESDPLVTDELFIRFTECSCVMPSMQFSYFPWNYAPRVNNAVLGYANLHSAIAFYINELIDNESLIVRPVWYENENGAIEQMYTHAGIFMLGRDLLCAPVLETNVQEIEVVLPKGIWVCAHTACEYTQGVYSLKVVCPYLPLFIRKENEKLLLAVTREIAKIETGFVLPNTTSASYCVGINREIKVTG